jgi:hypothetical protein
VLYANRKEGAGGEMGLFELSKYSLRRSNDVLLECAWCVVSANLLVEANAVHAFSAGGWWETKETLLVQAQVLRDARKTVWAEPSTYGRISKLMKPI